VYPAAAGSSRKFKAEIGSVGVTLNFGTRLRFRHRYCDPVDSKALPSMGCVLTL